MGQSLKSKCAFTGSVCAYEIAYVKRWLTEEKLSAFILKGEKRTLDSAYACGGYVAVLNGILRSVIADILNHSPEILKVKKEKAVVVRNAENDIQNALLYFGKSEKTCEENGTHFGNGNAHGNTRFAENIPEACGIAFEFKALDTEAADALLHVGGVNAGLAHAAEIALDIGKKNGHSHLGKRLRHYLHCYRFSGSGCAGYQTVPVSHFGQQKNVFIRLSHPNPVILVHDASSRSVFYLLECIIPQLSSVNNKKYSRAAAKHC